MGKSFSLKGPGWAMNRIEQKITPLIGEEVEFCFHGARITEGEPRLKATDWDYPASQWLKGTVKVHRGHLVLHYDDQKITLTGRDQHLYVDSNPSRRKRYSVETVIVGCIQFLTPQAA